MNNVVTRAIILNKEGKVLLGKRARSDSSGKWALIGGKPNEGESNRGAIIREVKEELGLLFKPTWWIEETDKISVPGEIWTVVYFYGKTDGSLKLKLDEVAEIIFVNRNDLENLDIAYDHKDLLINFFESKLK